MKVVIYDKTEKGREEILTRKYQLPSRMRSLLVLIDGKKTDAEIVEKISGLGLNQQSLQALVEQGLIQRVSIDTPTEFLFADDDILTHSTVGPLLDDPQTIFHEATEEEIQQLGDALTAHSIPLTMTPRIDVMKKFMAEAIKNAVGVKGFFFQRKIQKATHLNDIHALRAEFVLSILNAKGRSTALSTRDQFDQLLYIRFSLDEPEFITD